MSNIEAALYQQMRLSILLTTTGGEGNHSPFSEAYLYAWDNDVYPLFDELFDRHKPHQDQFAVSAKQLSELLLFLDEKWVAEESINFYALERHFCRADSAKADDWGRSTLISACRYMRLSRKFDPGFWSNLVAGGTSPSEAHVIVDDTPIRIMFR